jgi:hypothetical protein
MTALTFTPDPAMSYWPTPDPVAAHLVYSVLEPWHGDGDGIRVLEPSAGEGHLVRHIQQLLPKAHITAVEPDAGRARQLHQLRGVHVVNRSIEQYLADITGQAFAGTWQPHHLVIMNPPFTLPGRPEAWADHVLALYHDPHLLADGGILTALVPHIVRTGSSKKARAVRDLCTRFDIEACDRGAFAQVGAKVHTALIRIQKPSGFGGDQ